MIIVDLYHRWFFVDYNGGIAYSRDKSCYNLNSRYNKLRIKLKYMISITDKLLEHGYIEQKIGYKDLVSMKGHNTKIRATPLLINYIKSYNIDPNCIWSGERELIILKDENKKKIEYIDNNYTNKIREELLMYIDRLSKHDITIPGKQFLKIDSLLINRIFKSNWKNCGRFYGGWWQSKVKSEERKDILIDGSKTIELDYNNQILRILYALKQIDYINNGYDIDIDDNIVNRKLIKTAVMCMINNNSKNDAIKAMQNVVNKDFHLYSRFIDIKTIFSKLEAYHFQIKDYFYSNIGTTCQKIDSEICSRIINYFVSINKPILSIHDSFIVKREDKSLLIDTMYIEFQNVMQINVTNKENLIH